MIECQQQDIFKIRDHIPGHGLQAIEFTYRPLFSGSRYIKLACGCSIPILRLPKKEQDQVMKEIGRFQAENLLSIGTILLEEPLISNADLGNVKIKGAIAELPDVGGVRNNWLEEWFWKE